MTEKLEVFSDSSEEALKKWMMGEAVIAEQRIYDENGKALTVAGCPICRVSTHFEWLSKSANLIFRCW